MPNGYTNIYKLARKSTLYSREDAAEFLHISDRSLAAYESGERIPPNDVVNRMTILYHRPDLAVDHVRIASEPLQSVRDIFPDMQKADPREAAMELLLHRRRVASDRFEEDLLEILRDGRVTAEEEARYRDLMKDLLPLVPQVLTLYYLQHEED